MVTVDDGATVVPAQDRLSDWCAEYMPWNEVWWNLLALFAAFTLLVFLSTVTTFLIIDWRRNRIKRPPLAPPTTDPVKGGGPHR